MNIFNKFLGIIILGLSSMNSTVIANENYEQGNKYYKQGQFNEAIELYTKAEKE